MPLIGLDHFLASKQLTLADIAEATPARGGDAVYISGSLAAGHGTTTSDIDLYVLSAQDGAQFGPIPMEDYFGKDSSCLTSRLDTRQHVEIVPVNLLRSIYAELTSFDFNDPNVSFATNKEKVAGIDKGIVVETLHRLGHAVPLHNPALILQMQNELPRPAFFAWEARGQILAGDNIYDDIIGFLEAGEDVLAWVQSAQLLQHAGWAVLYASGISIDRDKWVPFFLRARAKDLPPVAEALLRSLVAPHPDSEAARRAVVENRLGIFNTIALYCGEREQAA
jgi:hypothetical protein